MQRKSVASIILFLSWLWIAGGAAAEVPEKGTLVFDVKDYETKTGIPKKVRKELENRGVQWGMVDNVLVITYIHMRHINADMPYLTRWGQKEILELEPGAYEITCISYDLKKYERDADKFIAKNAYVNEGILKFEIEAGGTTTLSVLPVYRKQVRKNVLTKHKTLKPDFIVTLIEEGQAGQTVTVNKRNRSSIKWGNYKGPLRFRK